MSGIVSTIATNHYVSFMVAMGEDESLGCHLSRSDALSFAENLKQLMEKKDMNEELPEIAYETDIMLIEGMTAGDVVMLSFLNKASGVRVQIAIDSDTSRLLMSSIQNAEQNNEKINGPDESSKSTAWKFFDLKKAS